MKAIAVGPASFVGSDLEEGVLGDGVVNVKAQVVTQLLQLGYGQAAVLSQNDGARIGQLLLQLCQVCSVLWVCHCLSPPSKTSLLFSAGAFQKEKPRARAQGVRHEKCRGMRKVENFQSLMDDQRSSMNFDSATKPFKLQKR